MSSERAAPFASKPPEGWDYHVEVMRATRMFLLQTKGPTRFVVRGEESDRKFTVLVGSRARCSCGVPLCLHYLFVMLKVLKVPSTNPLAWQTALIDSEVDCILSGGDGGGRFGHQKESGAAPSPGQRREFLRRGAGRTSAGGSSSKGTGDDCSEDGGGGGGTTRRLAIVPGEVCPVCQEEMEDEGDGGEVGEGGEVEAEGRLTYCRDGCGNNMHARCMLMYAEHRRSSGDKPCCPMCRVDWGITAVRALREVAVRLQGRNGKGGGRLGRVGKSNGSVGAVADAAATSTRAALVPVTCRSCSVQVQAAFFRCLVCGPAGSGDLCRRCYAMSGVRRRSNGGSSCTPVGRRRHPFVEGEAGIHPTEWKPAEPPDNGRRRGGPRGSGAALRSYPAIAGVLSLQEREITTADFELLLTLDASPVPPLHEHLLRALPRCDSTEATSVTAAGGLSMLQPTALLAQQRPSVSTEPPTSMLRRLRSSSLPANEHGRYSMAPASLSLESLATGPTGGNLDGGDIGHASVGARRGSEGSPPAGLSLSSQEATRTTVVAELMPRSSNVTSQSLSSLVAAAAVSRHATAEATAPAPASALASVLAPALAPAPVPAPIPTPTEGAAWDASGVTAVSAAFRVQAGSRVTSTAPSLPSSEAAPVCGSFIPEPFSCSFCSDIDRVGARGGSDNNAQTPTTTVGALRTGPRHASASSASPPSMRRLPCGHNAHDACLIPRILESVGRGDPSRCRCPLDSCAIFPVLSRRRRARRSRPGSDEGASTTAATAVAARHDPCNGTRSAPSATAPPASRVSDSIDRHARAAAAREAFRKSAEGCRGGAAADALSIMLVGSGLAHPNLHPPPPPPAGATLSTATTGGARVGERCRNNTAVPSRESGPMWRRAEENDRGEGMPGGERGGDDKEAGVRNGREVGSAGRREVKSTVDSMLEIDALVCGGQRILNGGRVETVAHGEPAVDGVRIRNPCRRSQRRRFPCVVRGSTVSSGGDEDIGHGGSDGRIGRFISSGGLTGDENGDGCTGAIEGLSVTSFPVASHVRGIDDGARDGTKHLSPSRRPQEVTRNSRRLAEVG